MLFTDTYKTILQVAEGTYKDKGSKFIAIAGPAATEEEVKDRLAEIRNKFHDARHHCFAYVLGVDKSATRYNDDGEPSGTAGRPIFGQINSRDLTNTLVVVVRYFGGVKLGVRGLINAYKAASSEALSQVEIITKTVNESFRIDFEYPMMNSVMKIVKDDDLKILSQDFQMKCSLEYIVRKKNANRVKEKFLKINGLKINYLSSQ
jgi:uncharacterized YigZ family protein